MIVEILLGIIIVVLITHVVLTRLDQKKVKPGCNCGDKPVGGWVKQEPVMDKNTPNILKRKPIHVKDSDWYEKELRKR